MVSPKFVVRPERQNAVMLRITINRKSAELGLGISLTKEELKDVLSGIASRRLAEQSGVITMYRNIVADIAEEVANQRPREISAAEFMNLIKEELMRRQGYEKPQPTGTFMEFYRKRMESKTNEGYQASIRYTYGKVEDFCKNKENPMRKAPELLTFEDITLKWLNAFDEWLAGQGAARNSRNIHFKNIRTVLNRAIDEELTSNYPFRRFKIRPEATRKRSMNVEELRRLFSCQVEDYQVFYRDMFKLIFMLCGINAVDLYNLERITPDGRVEYRRAKTHRLYSVKVEPEALEIIERWRGEKKLLCLADRWKDHRSFTKWINDALKKIGDVRIVGRGGKKEIHPYWPELTSYWARHSWATIAYNDCGISKDIISQALGHSTGSDITEIYLDKDQRLVDEANRRLLDYVLYDKRS